MWIYETLYQDIKIALKGTLRCKKKTPYQKLEIYDTTRFGKTLLLDGAIQTTEGDEFIYHEMLTHPVLLSHPNPKNILVIGAGDGGIIREILKHDVDMITVVEIDEEVIKFSEKHLSRISKKSFKHKKVTTIIGDGAEYVRTTKNRYDIVIVDSPDPIGPAAILFSNEFYQNIHSLLTKNGMLIRQTGSSFLQKDEMKDNYKRLRKIFTVVIPQIAAIPTYIGGFFTFLISCKNICPIDITYEKLNKKYTEKNLSTNYYNPQIHFASLAMPNYIKSLLT